MSRTHRRVRLTPRSSHLLANADDVISALLDIPCDNIDAKTIKETIALIRSFQKLVYSLKTDIKLARKNADKIEKRYKSGRGFPRRALRRYCNGRIGSQ